MRSGAASSATPIRLWADSGIAAIRFGARSKKRTHLFLIPEHRAHVGDEEGLVRDVIHRRPELLEDFGNMCVRLLRLLDDVARVKRLPLFIDTHRPREADRVAHANPVRDEVFEWPKRNNFLTRHDLPPVC